MFLRSTYDIAPDPDVNGIHRMVRYINEFTRCTYDWSHVAVILLHLCCDCLKTVYEHSTFLLVSYDRTLQLCHLYSTILSRGWRQLSSYSLPAYGIPRKAYVCIRREAKIAALTATFAFYIFITCIRFACLVLVVVVNVRNSAFGLLLISTRLARMCRNTNER